jgi:hypothetical protein
MVEVDVAEGGADRAEVDNLEELKAGAARVEAVRAAVEVAMVGVTAAWTVAMAAGARRRSIQCIGIPEATIGHS